MVLDEALKNVAVIGAAGKMGSGISALLLEEIARLEAEKTGKAGGGDYKLWLIDANEKGLRDLRVYLKDQLLKYAEKHIMDLRKYYSKNEKLVSNLEIITAFVTGAWDIVEFHTSLEGAKKANLIFEVIVEDVDAKVNLLNNLNNPKAYIFSNTSSIPIEELDRASHRNHRIIGFHFYSPPVVQKLVELIVPKQVDPALPSLALELAKRLNKTVVQSADIPGFIGNGHFIREALFACSQVRQLSSKLSLEESIAAINQMTQEFLIRPMGIFQLMDYVGLDVVQNIMRIMEMYSDDPSLCDELIERMVSQGRIGGQYPDGSQKPGFFQYDKHQMKAIYSFEKGNYVPIPVGSVLGPLPEGHFSWKQLQKEKEKSPKLETYFSHLFKMQTAGAELACNFLSKSLQIAQQLVDKGVAANLDDVETVLEEGFFHLYGPKLIMRSQVPCK